MLLVTAAPFLPSCRAQYNAVLRARTKVPFLVDDCEKLCKGNMYTTTLHAINSAVLKLSKLTGVRKVYRGVGGGRSVQFSLNNARHRTPYRDDFSAP